MLSPRMHPIRITTHIRIQLLLLLLLIKSTSKIGSIVSIIWLIGHVIFVHCPCNHTASPLILHISLIILIYHLVKKIIIYQIAFTGRILLINGHCWWNILSFEAYWRGVQAIVIVHFAWKFRTEGRLLDWFIIAHLFIQIHLMIWYIWLKHF